jgi:hypothetical protein
MLQSGRLAVRERRGEDEVVLHVAAQGRTGPLSMHTWFLMHPNATVHDLRAHLAWWLHCACGPVQIAGHVARCDESLFGRHVTLPPWSAVALSPPPPQAPLHFELASVDGRTPALPPIVVDGCPPTVTLGWGAGGEAACVLDDPWHQFRLCVAVGATVRGADGVATRRRKLLPVPFPQMGVADASLPPCCERASHPAVGAPTTTGDPVDWRWSPSLDREHTRDGKSVAMPEPPTPAAAAASTAFDVHLHCRSFGDASGWVARERCTDRGALVQLACVADTRAHVAAAAPHLLPPLATLVVAYLRLPAGGDACDAVARTVVALAPLEFDRVHGCARLRTGVADDDGDWKTDRALQLVPGEYRLRLEAADAFCRESGAPNTAPWTPDAVRWSPLAVIGRRSLVYGATLPASLLAATRDG